MTALREQQSVGALLLQMRTVLQLGYSCNGCQTFNELKLGSLSEIQIAGFYPRNLNLISVGWSPEICILNNIQDGPLITLPQSLPTMQNQRLIFRTHAYK